MKRLVLAVLISVAAVCAPVVSAAQQESPWQIFAGSKVERMVQCHWLIASNEDTKSDETGTPSEEEEPDCE